jgi:hypothetical protein
MIRVFCGPIPITSIGRLSVRYRKPVTSSSPLPQRSRYAKKTLWAMGYFGSMLEPNQYFLDRVYHLSIQLKEYGNLYIK